MKLSGARAIKRDYLLTLRRSKAITAQQYAKRIKTLEKTETKIQAKAQVRSEALENKKRIIKATALQVKAEKAKFATLKKNQKKNILFNGHINSEADLNAVWKLISGMTVRMILTNKVDIRFLNDETITVPDNYRDFRKEFLTTYLNVDYDSSINEVFLEKGKLLVMSPNRVDAIRLVQAFRKGIEHCVFVPIISKLEQMRDNYKKEKDRHRTTGAIKRMEEMMIEFSEGVPEDKMDEVARSAMLKLRIVDQLGNMIGEYNPKCRAGKLDFTNNRASHIEEGYITLSKGKEIDVSSDEMRNIWSAVKETNNWIVDNGIFEDCPRKLYTHREIYQLNNPDKETFDAFEKEVGFSKYRFCASNYPEVNAFIKEGRIINSWPCNLSDEVTVDTKGLKVVDLEKAYTQHKNCHMYQGFLGMIHQWGQSTIDIPFDAKFIQHHIGIYKINVLKVHGLLSVGTYTLPSPEILYYIEEGAEIEIIEGVWGSKFDFEYPNEMLRDRRYTRWAGRLSMERPLRTLTIPCESLQWAQHLRTQYENVLYFEGQGFATISMKKKVIYTSHHILAFITSYVRIQMMEAMKLFKQGQLVKVVMDGLYYRGDKPDGLKLFGDKKPAHHDYSMPWYKNSIVVTEWSKPMLINNTLLTGQGGSGKTYNVLTHKGFNDILFVSPTNILGQRANKQYNVKYATIHKLIGIECIALKDDPTNPAYPAVILIDEASMLPADWIEKVFELYPHSLIIIAGDINQKGQSFQCRNGSPGNYSTVWIPTIPIINIEGDRRSRDDTLKKLKMDIRSVMTDIFKDGNSGEEYQMQEWARRELECVSSPKAMSMFQPGDTWIAGTHKTNQKLLDAGIVSGYYKTGGYVSYEEQEGYEKKGAFTIHSYQGSTIENGKIFISINDMFEYAMLYTAVSRAVNYSQLVFVF